MKTHFFSTRPGRFPFRPLVLRAAGLSGLIAVLLPPAPLGAEVRSLTVGVDIEPYGLSGSWAEFSEALQSFAGVEFISKEPCLKTETFEMRLSDGRLPDMQQWEAFIRNTGLGASLRGMEATVDGWLERREGRAVLRVSRSGETLPLAPLTTKIQWHLKTKRPHPRSIAERRACKELLRNPSEEPRPVCVVGPLRRSPEGWFTLEVRRFHEQPEHFTARTNP